MNDYDRYEIGCRFPGECCMGHTDHFLSECYTAEMAEAEAEESAPSLSSLDEYEELLPK